MHDIVADNRISGTEGTCNAVDDGLDDAAVRGIVAPMPDVSTLALFASGLMPVAMRFAYGRRKMRAMG